MIYYYYIIQLYNFKTNIFFVLEYIPELSESMISALRLLDLKCKHNFTNNAFTDILNLIGGEETTLFWQKKN